LTLLVITPSRGRPQNIARLAAAMSRTCTTAADLIVGVDDDDPELDGYKALGGFELVTGPRKGLGAWTNELAASRASDYEYLASLGDDHVPRTKGWDAALTRAIAGMGGTGFSYPYDGTRDDIPEAVVMSSDIVRALGWMCEPSLQHWYVDTVWADLGRGAGCLRHCRAIAVDHVHPRAGDAPVDKTYADSGRSLDADKDAYYEWRRERMAGDIATVVALREAKVPVPA
jgi:hypothetical protein